MEKILFLNACIRPESRTLELAKCLLSKLEGEVEEVNLEKEKIQPLNTERLAYRLKLLAQQRFDDPMLRYACQFKEADTIVIAAPYYDLSFPSALKVYLEAVATVGLTFYYDDQENPQTLCKAKSLYYVSTAGGPFLPDYGFEYIKTLFETFYHIPEAYCFFAEKLDLLGSDADAILTRAKEHILREMGKD